jgi:peptide chain release factor 1
LESQLSDPGVVGDMQKFKKTSKEYKDLELIVKYLEYKNLLSNIDFNKASFKRRKGC